MLADEIDERIEIPYSDIPNFPASHVLGHENKLIIGKIYDKKVIAMQGRFHYYEGYEMNEVTFPIKVFALLGVRQLIDTNAAGVLNTSFKRGDLVLIKDHINLCCVSPLRGENYPTLGERFPGMRDAYSPRLIQLAKEQFDIMQKEKKEEKKEGTKNDIKGLFSSSQKKTSNLTNEFGIELTEELAKEYADLIEEEKDINLSLKEGVYAFMPGPQYETAAEIKMLTMLGADCVGMSTVPEVISAVHSGIEVLGISCITDECYTDVSPKHEEVVKTANKVAENFKALVMKIIGAM